MQSSMLRHITEDFGNGGTIDGDLTISGDLTVSGGGSLSFDEIIEGTQVIDVTSTEALLVRKNGDGGDILTVDTTNSAVEVGGHLTLPDASGSGGVLKLGASEDIQIYHDGSNSYLDHLNTGDLKIRSLKHGGDIVFHTESSIGTQHSILTLASDSSSTFAGDVSLDSALTLGVGGLTNGKINTPEAMYFNIDSDNSQTDTEFVWGCNRSADSGGTELMRLTEAGNLGIGVSSSLDHKITIKTSATGGDWVKGLQADGGQGFRIGADSGDDAFFELGSAGTSNAVLIQADGDSHFNGGNVGIGLSSSIDKKLHIASSTSTDGITIENTSTGATQIRFEADSSALRGLIGVDDSNGNAFLASTNGKAYVMCLRSEGEMHFGTNGNNVALQLDTSQNATFAGDVNIASGKNINFSPSVYTSAVQGIKFDQDGGTADAIIQPVRVGDLGVLIYLGSNTFVNTSGGNDRYNNSEESAGIEVRHDGQIRFLTGGTGADPTETMSINSDGSATFSGDVKIENSSSSAELEFKRTSSNTANFKLQAYNDIFELYDLANSKSKFKFDDNSRFSLSNTDDGGSGGADSTSANTLLGWKAGQSIASGGLNNSFFGHASGFNSSTGDHNTALGMYAGLGNRTGDGNTFVGSNAGLSDNVTSHSYNTGIGFEVLKDLTDGTFNEAMGKQALQNLTTGDSNIGIGTDALGSATTSHNLIAIGRGAGYAITNETADGTIAIGRSALATLTSGAGNTAVGYQTLDTLTTGTYNTAVGYQAMHQVDQTAVDSDHNTAVGYLSMGGAWADAESGYNVAVGNNTLAGVMNGANFNTAVGYAALATVTTADNNTAVGKDALNVVTTGAYNVAVGARSGDALVDGDFNVFLGEFAGSTTTSVSNAVFIGQSAGGGGNITSAANGTIGIGLSALGALTAGEANVAVGYQALGSEDDGSKSTAVGYQALTAQTGTTGTVGNTAVGYQAGNNITTGIENTIIGAFSTISAVGGQNQIVIGNGVSGEGNNKAVIGNSSITDVYMAKDSGALVHCAGIQFPATFAGNAGANVLDEYEEGAWTPVVKDSQSTPNAAGMASGTGFYTRIGQFVHVIFACQINSVSGMTSTDTCTVHGLPFTVDNNSAGGGEPSGGIITFMNSLDSTDFGSGVFVRANNNTTHFELKYTAGGATTSIGGSNFLVSHFDAGADTYMTGSCTYKIDH